MQRFRLVVGQSLGGEEVEDPGLGVGEKMLPGGQVVTERLPTGGAGDNDRVVTGLNMLPGQRLVGIEGVDAVATQSLDQSRLKVGGKRGSLGWASREDSPRGDIG